RFACFRPASALRGSVFCGAAAAFAVGHLLVASGHVGKFQHSSPPEPYPQHASIQPTDPPGHQLDGSRVQRGLEIGTLRPPMARCVTPDAQIPLPLVLLSCQQAIEIQPKRPHLPDKFIHLGLLPWSPVSGLSRWRALGRRALLPRLHVGDRRFHPPEQLIAPRHLADDLSHPPPILHQILAIAKSFHCLRPPVGRQRPEQELRAIVKPRPPALVKLLKLPVELAYHHFRVGAITRRLDPFHETSWRHSC
ncbi:MAG: hypothetical protein BJ554DRAFT_3425, partial [Olpidium bornovanus]